MIKFIASIAVGTILTLLLLTQNVFGDTQFIKSIENLLYEHTILLYFTSAILLLLPATILHFAGKKAYSAMINSDEDEIDEEIKRKAGYLDSSMSLVGVFIAINFMQYGMLYHKTTEDSSTLLVLFMAGILVASVLQVYTVKHVQSLDKRLKGDPTKGSFGKEFLNSMDEAEQLKAYKAGYESFQMIKKITLVMIIISILMNIIFGTGEFTIFISCLFMLVQTILFAYQEKHVS
jgi:hypothetical protein